ncbi:unnamed protein product, partial [Linum tenue]
MSLCQFWVLTFQIAHSEAFTCRVQLINQVLAINGGLDVFGSILYLPDLAVCTSNSFRIIEFLRCYYVYLRDMHDHIE